MMKCRSVLKAPVEAMFQVSINFEARAKWDVKIDGFKEFAMTPGYEAGRVAYNFKSPVKGVVSDRDFYIQQLTRRNFPRQGDICIMNKSLPFHPECPLIPGKVRATMVTVGFVYRPFVDDKTGAQWTDTFMVSCVDINGSVPKFFINNFSAQIPRENFGELERGAIAYSNTHRL